MSYREHIAADRRLAILRVLVGASDGRVNADIPAAEALDALAHRDDRATVHSDPDWPEARAPARLERLDDLVVVTAVAAQPDQAPAAGGRGGGQPRPGGGWTLDDIVAHGRSWLARALIAADLMGWTEEIDAVFVRLAAADVRTVAVRAWAWSLAQRGGRASGRSGPGHVGVCLVRRIR